MREVKVRIYNRSNPREVWETINPVLGPGEMGVELPKENDENKIFLFKLGDGKSTWIELPYASSPSGSGGAIVDGDMRRAIYDRNYNGKIDIAEDSERFGGLQPGSYVLKRELPEAGAGIKQDTDGNFALDDQTVFIWNAGTSSTVI